MSLVLVVRIGIPFLASRSLRLVIVYTLFGPVPGLQLGNEDKLSYLKVLFRLMYKVGKPKISLSIETPKEPAERTDLRIPRQARHRNRGDVGESNPIRMWASVLLRA
jgi:hypothetical protein